MIPVCPKCDEGLFILAFKGVEVDFCHRCRGVWLDAGELEALVTHTGASANDPLLQFQNQQGTAPRGRKHLCPRCDQPLREIVVETTKREPLTLDRCAGGHGLWFDADELRRLLEMCPTEAGAARTVDFLNELFGATPKQQ
jgi:Zn-finger nucleic acid-binding protein